MTFADMPLVTGGVVSLLAAGALARGWDRPFDQSEFIPADVDFFIHVDDPASARERLEQLGLGVAAAEVFGDGAIGDAWRALAASAGMSEKAMFDALLGGNATFAFRRKEPDGIDWVIVASIDDDAWGTFARRLELRIGAPVHGIAMLSLPEHEIALARIAPLVIAGPRASAHDGLLAESLALVAGVSDHSLRSDLGTLQPEKLGNGEGGIFIRHAPPLGGISAFAVDLGREILVLRHASRFANSPFGDAPRPTTLDRAFFDRLGEGAISVLAQPLEMPTGPLAAFVRARLPHGALTPQVEENLGERLYWVVSERPPVAADAAQGMPLLDLVLVVEVRDGGAGIAQLDGLCSGLARVLVEFAPQDQRIEIPAPDAQQLRPDDIRRMEIGPALARLYPRLIDPKAVSLNWMTVSGTNGQWWVVGTGEEAVARIGASLPAAMDNAEHNREIELDWQFGMVRGAEAAEHLRRLGARLSGMMPDQPQDARAVDGVIEFVSSLLGRMDRCIWKANLPGQNRVRSTWVLHFHEESEGADRIELRAVDRR